MSFEHLLGAIRAEDGDDPELAAATQLRLRRSLETRARNRHQLIGVLTTIAILFAGTVSWALATGHLPAVWSPPPRSPVHAAAPAPAPPPAPRRIQAMVAVPTPAPLPETAPPPAPIAPLPAPIALVPHPAHRVSAATPTPTVEALYRTAHNLHFHGGDPATTLAAWDAYLAAEPTGTFAVEARYNRALLLARLGRYAEARAALLPFARGTVDPPGYRQAEAEQLVDRLSHYP
jgi:hypothetical protein